MVRVRIADSDDLHAVLELWAKSDTEPTVTDDRASLLALLRYAPGSLLVAEDEDEDRIVGSLITGWDGWRGSFYRLAVALPYRRRGIARRLVTEGESSLVQLGAQRIAVLAVSSEVAAVSFWKAVGYTPQSDRQRLVKNISTG